MRPVQLKPAQLRPAQLRPEHFESAVRRQLTKRRGEWEELIWSLSFDQSIAKWSSIAILWGLVVDVGWFWYWMTSVLDDFGVGIVRKDSLLFSLLKNMLTGARHCQLNGTRAIPVSLIDSSAKPQPFDWHQSRQSIWLIYSGWWIRLRYSKSVLDCCMDRCIKLVYSTSVFDQSVGRIY